MERTAEKRALADNIVGHGDIASALTDINDPNKLFFASGVSNSKEINEFEYKREKDLLLAQKLNEGQRLVYFSSLSIYYSKNRYTQHKQEMEELIKNNFDNYCIVRVGNITWGDNPHTLINHFKNEINNGNRIDVRDEYRYLVDKDEFVNQMKSIPDYNCEINLLGRKMKVMDIVMEYVMRSEKL